jgi:hypothetical protein
MVPDGEGGGHELEHTGVSRETPPPEAGPSELATAPEETVTPPSGNDDAKGVGHEPHEEQKESSPHQETRKVFPPPPPSPPPRMSEAVLSTALSRPFMRAAGEADPTARQSPTVKHCIPAAVRLSGPEIKKKERLFYHAFSSRRKRINQPAIFAISALLMSRLHRLLRLAAAGCC